MFLFKLFNSYNYDLNIHATKRKETKTKTNVELKQISKINIIHMRSSCYNYFVGFQKKNIAYFKYEYSDYR